MEVQNGGFRRRDAISLLTHEELIVGKVDGGVYGAPVQPDLYLALLPQLLKPGGHPVDFLCRRNALVLASSRLSVIKAARMGQAEPYMYAPRCPLRQHG